MNKFVTLIFLLTLSLNSVAQSVKAGVRAGPNFARLHTSIPSSGYSNTSRAYISFSAELFANIRFNDFAIQPGLEFSGKGSKYNFIIKDEIGTDIGESSPKLNLYYLQVPVNFIYYRPIAKGEAFIGAGPYAGYRIGYNSSLLGFETTSSNIQVYSDASLYKKIDAGLNGLLGYKFANGMLLSLNYNWGLMDICVNNGSGSLTTRTLGASAGYIF